MHALEALSFAPHCAGHRTEAPPTGATETADPEHAAGRRAEKHMLNHARITHAEPASAAAHARGSEQLPGGAAKKRQRSGGMEHAVNVGAGAKAQGGAGFEPGDLGGGPGTANVFPLLQLPAEMQSLILGYVSLRDLARLACLNRELRAAYGERVEERDAAVTSVLESHFTAEFREGLTPAQTALPYDLVVDPPVRRLPLTEYYTRHLGHQLTHGTKQISERSFSEMESMLQHDAHI